ncbi:MAG: T9SS type A sorting domain-containing protein [Bacteroidetes bacterium]|nr:T9SS type A sorting domain-containing protein [Bacteroidota bacterium]
MKSVLTVFFLFFIFTFPLSAQETFINSGDATYRGCNTADRNDMTGTFPAVEKTQRQTEIENKIKLLRETGNGSERQRVEDLNSQLAQYNGNTIAGAAQYPAVVCRNNPPFMQPDNIGNTNIFSSPNYIHGLAVAVEQTGPTAGKIWVVWAVSPSGSYPDTVHVEYSIDNGITFHEYAVFHLGGTDKVNYDDLDIEIIEAPTGDKYIWGVYGLRSNGGAGNWFVGGFNLDITNFAGNFWVLYWPTTSTTNRYYNIRLTTDNAYYPSNAFTYIICSFDSTTAAGTHFNSQKYARCLNPYLGTAPVFSYLGRYFYWNSELDGPLRTLYSDIAYFRNGADTIIVSYSGIPDSTRIFFAKSDINGNAPVIGQSQAGTYTGYKHHGRLATNGNSNGFVLCLYNVMDNGHLNVAYMRTSNFGNFNNYIQSALWGKAGVDNYYPEIIGRRNASSAYFSFVRPGSTDSLNYYRVDPSGTITSTYRMNYPTSITPSIAPKPAFRYANGDSCFVAFVEYGPKNVWAATGCSGATIGVGNQGETVNDYFLNQNYPNPFNPMTSIQYGIPKSGLVKLIVYDVLGKEVSVLVNEVKNAGKYIISYNASSLPSGIYFYKLSAGSYTEIKKMVLVK